MPWRSIKIIILCITIGVVLGAVIGLIIGVAAPSFCYAIFQVDGSLRHADAAREIGLGLGIANGISVGLVAGIGVVVAEAIKSWKKPNP